MGPSSFTWTGATERSGSGRPERSVVGTLCPWAGSQAVERDLLGLSFEWNGRSLDNLDIGRNQEPSSVLAKEDGVARLSGGLLHSLCNVHTVADDAELQTSRTTDVAGQDRAGVQTDADGDLVPQLLTTRAISTAAVKARSAWSGKRVGAPKTASNPSPTNLFTCPPWR
jgi:hypothetical protein